MKKILLLSCLWMLSMNCISAEQVKNSDISISGLWWLSSADRMSAFLGVKHDGQYFDFAMEIVDGNKIAKIYFVDQKQVYLVDVEKISKNKYTLKVKGSKREFVVDNNPANSGSSSRTLYFLDSSPFPPVKNRFRCDGGHYYEIASDGGLVYSIDSMIDQIKLNYSIDSPE